MEPIEGNYYRLKIKTWQRMLDDGYKEFGQDTKYIKTYFAFTRAMEKRMPENRIITCELVQSDFPRKFVWVTAIMNYSISEDMIEKILNEDQVD